MIRPRLFETNGSVGALFQHIKRGVLSGSSLCAGELGADELGGGNHVGKGRHHLGVLAGLETAVRVHPQDVGVEHGKHLVDAVSNLLCGGDPGRVDVIDTRANASSVCHALAEDGEELLIGPGVLNGDDISVHVNDGVDDVVEVRVAHVSVDLPREKVSIRMILRKISEYLVTVKEDYLSGVLYTAVSDSE